MEPIPPAQFYGNSGSSRPKQANPPIRSQTLQVPGPDTTIRNDLPSHYPYSSYSGQYRQDAFVAAEKEVRGRYVRTTPEAFLARYLPNHPAGMPDIMSMPFEQVEKHKVESRMYEPLITALAPFLKDGWKAVNTSNSPDPLSGYFLGHKVKPDITVYSPAEPSNDNLCRACDMETFIELKLFPLDEPFSDAPDSLEKPSGQSCESRGQLITYLNSMQAAQYRTHSFGVFILGGTCRLLRHTLSGIEFTESFDYTNTDNLQRFFWRLSHATRECRGIDTTFERVPRFEPAALSARVMLEATSKPLWKVTVGEHSFYVGEPFTRSHHYPIGRGTRCFVAIECETKQRCLLKDTWRLDEYHPEGQVYAKLHKYNVRNIAGVIASGDVLNHRCGSYPPGWYVPKDNKIRKHTHYRLVLNVVGHPLTTFPSTYWFVSCIRDCALAHLDAFTEAGVSHRDISVGNIVFVNNNDGTYRGILIDWEFSKDEEDGPNRVSERTGTRQFMAARLCSPSPPPRTIEDDVESFVLLLLWMAVRYASNKMTPASRGHFLAKFDAEHDIIKRNMILVGGATVDDIDLLSSELRLLLTGVMRKFHWRYKKLDAFDEKDANAVEELRRKQADLNGHGWLLDILNDALQNESWKEKKDPSDPDQEVEAKLVEVTVKRKSECSEYEQVRANKRPWGSDHPPYFVDKKAEEDPKDEEDWDEEATKKRL